MLKFILLCAAIIRLFLPLFVVKQCLGTLLELYCYVPGPTVALRHYPCDPCHGVDGQIFEATLAVVRSEIIEVRWSTSRSLKDLNVLKSALVVNADCSSDDSEKAGLICTS